MSKTEKELEKLEQSLSNSITAVELAVGSAVEELEQRASAMESMVRPTVVMSTSKMRALKKRHLAEVVTLRLVSSARS